MLRRLWYRWFTRWEYWPVANGTEFRFNGHPIRRNLIIEVVDDSKVRAIPISTKLFHR